jgi:phage-related protein
VNFVPLGQDFADSQKTSLLFFINFAKTGAVHATPQAGLVSNPGGCSPFWDWFNELNPKARAKCRVRLEQLSREGFDLRRLLADYLREGIYELRFKHLGVNFRVLYFFHDRNTVVISHGFQNQAARVPSRDIDLAKHNKAAFGINPENHSFE